MNDIEINENSIRLAYRLILGREPENAAVIDGHLKRKNLDELRQVMLSSREFKAQQWMRSAAEDFKNKNNAFKSHEGIDAAVNQKMEIIIHQTADNEKYVKMLQATSKTVTEYIKGSDIRYDAHIGVRRGCYPHHAIFNRIHYLQDLIKSDFRGWVLYMDADAYINDLNFDLKKYLEDKSSYAMIFAPATHDDPRFWNVNDGVFFANLSHPVCRELLNLWASYYSDLYRDDDYERAKKWNDVINDQTSLHSILRGVDCADYILSGGEVAKVINTAYAQFIRQKLRDDADSVDESDSFEKRVKTLECLVDDILKSKLI